jgi:probable F420-dependent oxidoreductase
MRFTIWHSTGDPDDYIETAIAAEEAGFTSTSLHESVFYPKTASAPYPYSDDGERHWEPEAPFLEPMVMLAAIFARTTTLRAYTYVLKFPLHHPLLVYKRAATLHAISHGRFGLGLGPAVWPEEFEYTQTDFASRRERLLEGIEIIRLAGTGEMVEYHGQHYDFGPLLSSPGIPGAMPIYIGGHKLPSLRMAVDVADGWVGVPSTWEETARCVSRLHELLDERGRSYDDFEIHGGALEARTLDDFRRLEDMGLTDIVVSPTPDYATHSGELTTRDKVEWVERFSDKILARV